MFFVIKYGPTFNRSVLNVAETETLAEFVELDFVGFSKMSILRQTYCTLIGKMKRTKKIVLRPSVEQILINFRSFTYVTF